MSNTGTSSRCRPQDGPNAGKHAAGSLTSRQRARSAPGDKQAGVIVAKEVETVIKLQAPGGNATPAPPIGPALGQHGVNIGQFVSQFNERTKDAGGLPLPVEITVYADKSFTFIVKSPPAAVLLKQVAKPNDPELRVLEKGSGVPHREKVGTVTQDQVREIAEKKMQDLNAFDVEAACRIVAGTARSMGIDVVE